MTAADNEPERGAPDIGEYCRRVEAYLTQVNGGHIVRVVGPGFELVRDWAERGVPFSIVMRGIDRKAERHARGRAARPLRIEFCEADVRAVHDEWRRAVGLVSTDTTDGERPARKPSLPKHLERVLDRLGRIAGRLDLPDELRDGLESIRHEVQAIAASADGTRGAARDGAVQHLERLDRELIAMARRLAPSELRQAVEREAEADLAPYRERLAGPAWRESVELTAARLLRDRLGLPTLALS